LKSPLTIAAFENHDAQEYGQIYGQLQNAAQQGFPLSVLMDHCPIRPPGLFSEKTNVNLVCQRCQGKAATKQYNVVDCSIQIKAAGFSGQSASCPTLLSTLEMHCKQGYKVASIYNPPGVSLSGGLGLSGVTTACHIVLEKTQTQYSLYIFDVPFRATLPHWQNPSKGDHEQYKVIQAIQRVTQFGWDLASKVDHEQYISVIQRFAQAGWELAAVLDMPDETAPHHKDDKTFSDGIFGPASVDSTIKLIFQCRTDADPVVVMQVQCPQDSGPGQTIQVSHPQTGAAFQCTVPENVQPGSVFKIEVPASKDTPAPSAMLGGSTVAAAIWNSIQGSVSR
jgi:hypothetical protein